MATTFIHETAIVSPDAQLEKGIKVWMNVQIREKAIIGECTILSKDVYIDHGVSIGARCKIQNGVSVYNGVTIEEDVFVGPHAMFTNDKVPRAFNSAWKVIPTRVCRGASIGANATVICGITIGEFGMVAAGSVVTRDVPAFTLVVGNPARVVARVDRDGNRIEDLH